MPNTRKATCYLFPTFDCPVRRAEDRTRAKGAARSILLDGQSRLPLHLKNTAPYLLLLSAESPHSASPGGIVLARLLSDYPAEKLLVVTNHLPTSEATKLDCRYEFLPLVADRLNSTRFAGWRPILRAFGASGFVSTARVDAALAGFVPQVVATLMQDSWFYDLAANFALFRKLPLVLLVHDLAHGFESVPSWVHKRQIERDKRIVRQASTRLCISAPMAEFFAHEFGAQAEVLHPPRAERPVSQAPERAANLRQPGRLTLGYAGGLHYGYGEQLLRMVPVLRATGTRVEVFGPLPGGSVAGLSAVTDVFRFHGLAPTPEEAWRGLLERCDAVLQPYLNPPGPHELQYRTHFPSKLGEALSIGLPLLVTGPDYASGSAWCAARPGSALLVTEAGTAPLRAALERLRDDAGMRVRLAGCAQQTALELSAPMLRHRFQEHVLHAARV